MTLSEPGRFCFFCHIWARPACCVSWLAAAEKVWRAWLGGQPRAAVLREFRHAFLWFHHRPLLLRQLTSERRELASALKPLPAIHGHDFSIDVPGAIANQECGQVGKLFDGSKPSQRDSFLHSLLQLRARQQTRERALGRNRAGRNGVHTNSAIAPLDGQTLRQRLHSCLRHRRWHHIRRARRRVGGGNVQDDASSLRCQPAPPASHRRMQRAHQDDANHRLKPSQRKFFGARQKISCRIVHEHIERTFGPDGGDHLFDGCRVAHVAGMGVDLAARAVAQFFFSGRKNFLAAAADVDFRAQVQKPLRGSFAQTGAAAGDQDALGLKQIFLEHRSSYAAPKKASMVESFLVSLKRYPDTNQPDMKQGSFRSLRDALAGYWILAAGYCFDRVSPPPSARVPRPSGLNPRRASLALEQISCRRCSPSQSPHSASVRKALCAGLEIRETSSETLPAAFRPASRARD